MSVRLNVVVEVDAMLWRCWDCDYWHASGDAVEDMLGKVDDVRKAYKAIEDLLLKLGIVIPAGTVGARSDGWTPWEAPRI